MDENLKAKLKELNAKKTRLERLQEFYDVRQTAAADFADAFDEMDDSELWMLAPQDKGLVPLKGKDLIPKDIRQQYIDARRAFELALNHLVTFLEDRTEETEQEVEMLNDRIQELRDRNRKASKTTKRIVKGKAGR
jgi:hypothetical protein